jgi:hypothetical protein
LPQGQYQGKLRPLALPAGGRNQAIVLFDDLPGEGQADAGCFIFFPRMPPLKNEKDLTLSKPIP